MKPPVDPELAARMRALGRAIAEVVPEGHGFVLFTFARSGTTTYVSNAKFHDVQKALETFIAQMKRRDEELS